MLDSKSTLKKAVYFNPSEIIFIQLFGADLFKSILEKSQAFFKKYTLCRKFVLGTLMIIMWFICDGFWYEMIGPMFQSSDFVFDNLPSLLVFLKYCSIFSIYHFIYRLTAGSVLTPHIWYGEQNLVAQDERDVCVRDFYLKESYYYMVIIVCMQFGFYQKGSELAHVNLFILVPLAFMLPMILATWNAESIDQSYLNRRM